MELISLDEIRSRHYILTPYDANSAIIHFQLFLSDQISTKLNPIV